MQREAATGFILVPIETPPGAWHKKDMETGIEKYAHLEWPEVPKEVKIRAAHLIATRLMSAYGVTPNPEPDMDDPNPACMGALKGQHAYERKLWKKFNFRPTLQPSLNG